MKSTEQNPNPNPNPNPSPNPNQLCAALAFALSVPLTLAADAAREGMGIAVITLLNSLATMASSTAGVASFAATNNAAERFPARKGLINGVHITAEAIG